MKNNQGIHITTDGKTTYAVLKQNGKVLSRSEAKCHPDDKFDFETGAKIALDRLEIKKEVDEPKNPFKPGDIVECIFDFKTFGAFPPKGTMGKVISITRQGVLVRWANGSTYGNGEWWISACDIRKIDQHEEPFKVGDIVEYISDEVSRFDSTCFPPKGTRGEILELDDHKSDVDYCVRVRWEKGTTGGNGEWWCRVKKLKKVDKSPKYSFKVGDRVRFRSWDDMEREFGMDAAYPKGGICIRGGLIYFSHCMRPLCGTYATIETMRKYETGITEVKLKDFSCKDTWLRIHVFSTDMLEPASTKEYKS